jgi:hypothetical protein
VHYFDSDLHYKAGPKYYVDHFWKPKCHKKYIDATPNYLDSAAARARMVESFRADELPRKKFIVVLREPIARAYSWYNHLMRHCVNTIRDYTNYKVPPRGGWDVQTMCDSNHCRSLGCAAKARYVEPGREVDFLATFKEFVDSPAFPFETGLYMHHLEGWLQHFRRDQFFIVSFETLLAHTHDVVLRLSLFLQLSPWPSSKTSSVLPHDNAALVETTLDCATRDVLRDRYTTSVQHLYAFMGVETQGEGAHTSANSSNFSKASPPSEPRFPAFSQNPLPCSVV